LGLRRIPLTMNRKMAAASAAVCRERDTIHIVSEVDVSVPRRLIGEIRERTGERVSFTAYLVACLARVVGEQPQFNSLISRGRLVYLDGVTVGVLVEREIDGERIPEPMSIRDAEKLSLHQIHDLIRAAQQAGDTRLGGLSGASWVRFVPSALFRPMIRIMSRNARVAQRYGVVTVTAVGMFGEGAHWLVPLSAATVAMGVGGIVERPHRSDDGIEWREHLCLTLSFDHDLIDGAPAARFSSRLSAVVAGGELLADFA